MQILGKGHYCEGSPQARMLVLPERLELCEPWSGVIVTLSRTRGGRWHVARLGQARFSYALVSSMSAKFIRLEPAMAGSYGEVWHVQPDF